MIRKMLAFAFVSLMLSSAFAAHVVYRGHGGGYGHGYGYGVNRGYYNHGYYGVWNQRRWDRFAGGYWYGPTFYAVPNMVWYQCTASNMYGQVFSYAGDYADAQIGAVNTCTIASGGMACALVGCVP